MRPLVSLVLLTLSGTALAGPSFTWQSRLLGEDGSPLNGTHSVRLTLSDASDTELWSQQWSPSLSDG